MIMPVAEQVRAIFRRGPSTSWLVGQVDGAGGAMLSGWAFSPGSPRRRLDILVESTPGAFTEVRADLYRADVHRAGRGSDGYCGFSVPLRQLGWPGPLRILAAGTGRALPGSPWAAAGAPLVARARERDGLRFRIRVGGGALAGWVMDPRDPLDRRRLRLDCDGRCVSRTTACLFDAEARGPDGDGFHGFSLALPPSARAVRLIDEASGTALHDGRR